MKKLIHLVFLLSLSSLLISCVEKTTTYTVTFDTQGGENINSITKLAPGSEIELPKFAVKLYHTFIAWYTDPDFTNESLVTTDVYTVNSNVTFYAFYEPNIYTLELISNVGQLYQEQFEIAYGSELNLPILVSDQYDFVGWTYDGELYTEGTMLGRNATFIALWTNKLFNITFELNGGTFVDEHPIVLERIASGSTVTLPNVVKDHSFFTGWYLSNDSDAVRFTESSVVTSDLTLYAHFEDPQLYKINYVLNQGSFEDQVIDYYYSGEGLELPIPTREGYRFMGWYLTDIFSRDPVTSILTSEAGDKTYYALWQEIKSTYTVSYYDLDGNLINVETVAAGEVATYQALPNQDVLVLAWFNQEEKYDFDLPVNQDLELHVKWDILADYLIDLVPNTFFDNVTLIKTISTSLGNINISWKSSDQYTLTNNGVTNPFYQDVFVTLTATFTFNGKAMSHDYQITIPGIVLKDLEGVKPVFAYFYNETIKGTFNGYTNRDLETIDVINYAFARVNNNSTVNINGYTRLMDILQARKAGVRVLLCIGGYGASTVQFSDAAATPENREIFAQSVLDIIELYHFDGVDIDWEYPGFYEGGVQHRPVEEDRANYTLMMTHLKNKIKAANPIYLLTAAIPGGVWSYTRYNIPTLNNFLDYALIMTYDFHESTYIYHHAALYNSVGTRNGNCGADSLALYLSNGISKDKLILGIAFYGRKYTLKTKPNKASDILGSNNIASSGQSIHYTSIYNNYLNKGIGQAIWDNTAKAPYIYVESELLVITYDSPSSIMYKCQFVKNQGYGGVMFWDYGEDQTKLLLDAIYQNMKA